MRRTVPTLVALTALAGLARYLRLAEGGEPPGTDGYYYVVQAETWAELGRLHVPDASWMLPLPGVLVRAGLDPVVAVTGVSAALAAIVVPAAFVLGRAMGGSPRLPWLLALWAACSPTVGLLASEFPKNLAFVAPAFVAIAATATLARRWHPAALLGALIAGAAAATAHRLGAAFLLITGSGAAVSRVDRRIVLAALGAAALFSAASAVLPGLLHPADLDRLAGQLGAPGWPAAPWCWFELRSFSFPLKVELVLAWPALVAAGLLWWRARDRSWAVALGGPVVLAVVVPWRTGTLDIGYRLALVGVLAAIPLVLLAVDREASRRWPNPGRGAIVAALCVGLIGPWVGARSGHDPDSAPPYGRYRALVETVPRPLPELLIAHQGINFLYDHLTGSEAMAWAPEPELDPQTVGRIAWGIRDGEWTELAPDADPAPVRLGGEYSYVREDVWRAFLAAAGEAEATALEADDRADRLGADDLSERIGDWRNPSRVRPASLLRNRNRRPGQPSSASSQP